MSTLASVALSRPKPPAAVRQAIASFRPVGAFKLLPRKDNERSFIFDWGVRVVHENGKTAWLCLASEECCQKKDQLFVMSADRTTVPVTHLREVHDLLSEKTQNEQQKKRKRDEEASELENAAVFANNPSRLNKVVETQRIINNNLPFAFVESRETTRVNRLTKKEEMADDLNARQVHHLIVEMYTSTKIEIIDVIAAGRLKNHPSIVIMIDFWSCKVAKAKFLGVRVRFIDDTFQLRTILLGVREFKPWFADRSSRFRECVQAYVVSILEDFHLTVDHIFAGASDMGSDVRGLLQNELNYSWEWCLAHMAHAATKEACGMGSKTNESPNPDMTELIKRMNETITSVKLIEKTGDLFEALCQITGQDKAKKLIDCTDVRFLSITNAMERILSKWTALEQWYEGRVQMAISEGKRPPSFPLANDKLNMIQLYSLLKPIASIKRKCHATNGDPLDVVMDLYHARLNTLHEDTQLEHYESTDEAPKWIDPSTLTPLTKKTRLLLRNGFDGRFSVATPWTRKSQLAPSRSNYSKNYTPGTSFPTAQFIPSFACAARLWAWMQRSLSTTPE